MKEEEINTLKEYMQKTIGLNPDSLCQNIWLSSIHKRMKATNCQSVEEYFHEKLKGIKETQELVELLTIPETWFFREQEAFDYFKEHLQKFYVDKPLAKPLHILCLPASTGEEPYSIAISLLDAGMRSGQFMIEGVDVSRQGLKFAERGCYGLNAFRKIQPQELSEHFVEGEEGYQIVDRIKKMVRFRYGNAMEPASILPGHTFDFIFCRNLLIYLTQDVQRQLLHYFRSSLEQNGRLILGAAELDKARHVGFIPEYSGKCCAFRKPLTEEKRLEEKQAFFQRCKNGELIETMDAAMEKKSEMDQEMRNEVKKMANEGRVDEALINIDSYLKKFPFDAKGYFLKGLIQHSRRNEAEAEEAFKNALYLDPKQKESLTYLSLIYTGRNEPEKAKLYKKRAEEAG